MANKNKYAEVYIIFTSCLRSLTKHTTVSWSSDLVASLSICEMLTIRLLELCSLFVLSYNLFFVLNLGWTCFASQADTDEGEQQGAATESDN